MINVLVRGAFGNIGTTVTALLLEYQKELGIGHVFAHKRTMHSWTLDAVDRMRDRGAVPCSDNLAPGFAPVREISNDVNYIFECGPNGVGLTQQKSYEDFPNLRGACAQGSEKGFGVPFMPGINDQVVAGQRYVQVVSCNCHGTASLLTTFAGPALEDLTHSDFVVVRRSEDVGSHGRLVGSNVVVRHLDPPYGTHHARDVRDVFATIGIIPPIQTSDINTPSQLLHSIRFSITTRSPLDMLEVKRRVEAASFVTSTDHFDSNVLFEIGRRFGYHGRLYEHSVVVLNNLLFDANIIRGWAFVPQEGATIISTLYAFALQTACSNAADVFAILKSRLLMRARSSHINP